MHLRLPPSWLTGADRRGLRPLFWSRVRPYGEVCLDMGARLRIGVAAGARLMFAWQKEALAREGFAWVTGSDTAP